MIMFIQPMVDIARHAGIKLSTFRFAVQNVYEESHLLNFTFKIKRDFYEIGNPRPTAQEKIKLGDKDRQAGGEPGYQNDPPV
ncbi:MAG: hypothetical protein AABY93_18550 [Bacteroidota bacterium]